MLGFFRKYQKIFFAFIVVVIAIAFTFYGSHSALEGVKKVKDKDIGLAVDGSKMMLSEVDQMSYFLQTDAEDTNSYPNMFNDGVLRKDFFFANLIDIFVDKYFEDIKPSLEKNFEKVKIFQPYTNPYSNTISQRAVWEQFNSEIPSKLSSIQKEEEISPKYLKMLIELYTEELKFSPSIIKRFLVFKELDLPKHQKDHRLENNSLTLFNNKNLQDWFGKDFIDMISQFIINTSKIAIEKGYKVTSEEAYSDLLSNLNASLKKYEIKDQSIDYFARQLQVLGFDEKTVVKTWKTVLLFRKYFNDVANNVYIDNLAFDSFAEYALKTYEVSLYHLPNHLNLNTFDDLINFEVYLHLTSSRDDVLSLPTSFYSVEKIEKNYPELIETDYEVILQQTTLDKVALMISEKDLMSWQVEDKNYSILKDRFKLPQYAEISSRYSALEDLSDEQRIEMDKFSKEKMIFENSSMISDNLLSQESKTMILNIRSKGGRLNLSGIKDVDLFKKEITSNDIIENYTQDQKNYYRIQVKNNDHVKKMITFENAKSDGTIRLVVDEFLKEKAQVFSDKEYLTIKHQIAKNVFKDLLKALEPYLSEDKSLNSYANARFMKYMEDYQNSLVNNTEFEQTEEFKIENETKDITKSNNPTWIETIVPTMALNAYSKINNQTGNIEFFYLNEIKNQKVSDEKMKRKKIALSNEAKTQLGNKLINEIHEKRSITLPVRKEKQDDA